MYRLTWTPESKNNFIQIRNKCTSELREAVHFQQHIKQSATNPKTLCQTLKVITGGIEKKKNFNIAKFLSWNRQLA